MEFEVYFEDSNDLLPPLLFCLCIIGKDNIPISHNLKLMGTSLGFALLDPGTDIELQGLPEPGIELEGFAESISVAYNGPPFPPSVPARQEAVDIVDRMIKCQESIENQLVEWVEQEIMSHIISEMYPLQHQPVPHISQPEDEENALSGSDVDIAHEKMQVLQADLLFTNGILKTCKEGRFPSLKDM
eukprot:g48211.t1